MTDSAATSLTPILADALRRVAREMRRLEGRDVQAGLHETKELGPALERQLREYGARHNWRIPINDWTRKTTEADLVIPGQRDDTPRLVAELKVWDIGHQLFDLAKLCCLLNTGADSAYLVCVARKDADFEHKPGGELFPFECGAEWDVEFEDLIRRNVHEWRHHVGHGRPEPRAVPTKVRTTAILDPVPICAYPGHSMRAARVTVTDPSPVALVDGWPKRADRPHS